MHVTLTMLDETAKAMAVVEREVKHLASVFINKSIQCKQNKK